MKIRIRYAKLGKIRFTGHRDIARIWERSLRKARLPVALSAGFSPRPRVSFGLALPTGAESVAEYLDVVLDEAAGPVPGLDEIEERLAAALPGGVGILAVAPVEQSAPSLQEDVVASEWEIVLRADANDGAFDLEARVAEVLAATELPCERERKGVRQVDDVRSAIEILEVTGPGCLRAVIAVTGRSLRPHELVVVLLPDHDPVEVTARVLRTHQWIERDGARHDVLSAAVMTPADTGA
jgi:radical SAM-linked protein